MFDRLDGNGDGKITQEEFSSAIEKRLGKSAATSSDAPDAASIFKKMDTDSDGAINVGEFKAAMSALRQQGGPAGGAGGPPPAGAASTEEDTNQIFDELDTNKDGVVSMAELLASLKKDDTGKTAGTGKTDDQARLEKLFAAVDGDGDGAISKSELSSFMDQMRKLMDSEREAFASYRGDGTAAGATTVGENLSVDA